VGTLPTQRTFTGQYSDATGLMYFNARYYSGALGRFVSADSIVPGAGEPQALNRYAFVLNNPLRHVDPSGHEPCETGTGLDCSGGTRNATDDGYRQNSNTWQRRLNRWVWQQRSKAYAAYSEAAWQADKWLYEKVPSAVGVQFPSVSVSAGEGLMLTGEGTRSYLFNWRSGELDEIGSLEAGIAGGISVLPVGLAGKVGAFAVWGASSNASWEGNYASGAFEAYTPYTVGAYVGGSSGVVNDPVGKFESTKSYDPSTYQYSDPVSHRSVDTWFGGVGVGVPGLTVSFTMGTTFYRNNIFDLNMPFPIIPPGNPYLGGP
jgi:RHS repeat-associated protein